jgi:hypothetical protein
MRFDVSHDSSCSTCKDLHGKCEQFGYVHTRPERSEPGGSGSKEPATMSSPGISYQSDSEPSEARKRGSGGGSPREVR